MNYQSSPCSRNVPCSLIYTVPPLMCCLRVIGFFSTPSPSSDIGFLFFVIVYLFTFPPLFAFRLLERGSAMFTSGRSQCGCFRHTSTAGEENCFAGRSKVLRLLHS